MMFDGSSGMRPNAQARRYVYAVAASALETDLGDPDGWVFGGMEEKADRVLARKAALKVIAELRRKARSHG